MRTGKGHGMSGTPEYARWEAMKRRCYNRNCIQFPRYGGRGIAVCDRWRGDFLAFLADMGPLPFARAELERKNNDAAYSPSNCVWATRKDQANNRSTSHLVEYIGLKLTVQQWSERLNIPAARIYGRLTKLGMRPGIALSPSKRSNKGLGKQSRTW